MLSSLSNLSFAMADEARWYQVEVLLFAHERNTEKNPEIWPASSNLEKPWLFHTLTNQEEPEATTGITSNDLVELVNSGKLNVDDAKTWQHRFLTKPEQLDDAQPKPTPFQLLGRNSLQMMDKHQTLSGNPSYRVLFHDAWNQPLYNDEAPTPILIEAGEEFAGINELRGYLNIQISRYLHVDTNLFLTEFERSNNPMQVVQDQNFSGFSFNQSDNRFSLFNKPQGLTFGSSTNNSEFYIATNSAHLNQKRKIASGDIHLIDNPKLSMLILFTKYENIEQEQEQDEMAEKPAQQ